MRMLVRRCIQSSMVLFPMELLRSPPGEISLNGHSESSVEQDLTRRSLGRAIDAYRIKERFFDVLEEKGRRKGERAL